MTDSTAPSTPATPAPKRKRGPNKPLQGKFEIEALQETAAPARKPLVGGSAGPRETQLTELLSIISQHKGQLFAVFTSPDPQEVFKKRVSLLQAAERVGVHLDEKNTASRSFVKDGAQVTAGGKNLYALYARVLTDDEVPAALAAKAAEEAKKAAEKAAKASAAPVAK